MFNNEQESSANGRATGANNFDQFSEYGAPLTAGDINATPSSDAANSIKVVPRSKHRKSLMRQREVMRQSYTGLNNTQTDGAQNNNRRSSKHRKYISAQDLEARDPYSNSGSRSRRRKTSRTSGYDVSSAASAHTMSSAANKSDIYTTGRLSQITADIAPINQDIDNDMRSIQNTEFEKDFSYEVREHNRKQKPRTRGSKAHSSSEQSHNHSLPPQGPFRRFLNTIIAVFSERRTRLIAIAVLLLVVAIAIVASMLISSASNNDGELIEVQGAAQGSSSTQTDSDDQGNTTATVTTANGNPVLISIEVEEGKTSLINVNYDDDVAYNGTAVGPWTREFRVTKSFYASFGTPDSVKVTENGKEIQLTKNSDGTASLTVNIQAAGLAEK